jgi:diguanylate cyclase (GGDEF)-like protein
MHARLRLLRRQSRTLRTRVALLFIGLLAVVMAATILVAGSGLSLFAERAAERDMAANARVFERLVLNREEQMRTSANVVARDFGFREAFATGDRQTIKSALDSLAQRTGAHAASVISIDGDISASTTGRRAFDGDAILPMLDNGVEGGIVSINGELALAVAAPIEMPDLVGWLLLAQPMDRQDLTELGRLAAVPIQAELREAKTLGPSLRGTAPDRVIKIDDGSDTQLVRLVKVPSLQRGITPTLVLRYSLERAMEGFRTLRLSLILIALAGAALGAWLSLRFANSITLPLRLLSSATRRYARGTVSKVEVGGTTEVATLAANFNAMVDAIEERERQITHAALHDGLTNVPNRRFFLERLDRAVSRQSETSRTMVAYIDLDDFKAINDTMGHATGDGLLRHVAGVLQEQFPDATVARFGGDEFGVLFPGLTANDDCASIARSLHEAISKDAQIEGRLVTVSASMGIAIGPGDGATGDNLLKSADLALYRAKNEGKSVYHFFEPSLDEEASRRRRIEADMRQAVRDGAFELHFQPLYSLDEQRLKGFETLMRWTHPERGPISPAEFIPIAEETGLIVQMGEWAVREACAQAATWPDDISVAVNISPRQFASPTLAQTIVQSLARAGVQPHRLELEITESIFIGNVEKTLTMLHSLRSLGIRIALDDFGTGYSSLSYLRSFPFDKLKIDQSFVRDLGSDSSAKAIIRAITTLADALGIETLAEGVEEQAHLEALRDEGCNLIQGYLISRPVAANLVAELIANFAYPVTRAAVNG